MSATSGNLGGEKKVLFPRAAPEAPAIAPETAALNTRLHLLEEKSTNLNRKIELLEANFVGSNKKNSEAIHALDAEFLEVKRELDALKQKVELIVRELKLTAGKDELTTIKRYLELWNLTRFVSRDEVERIIEEKMEERLEKTTQ